MPTTMNARGTMRRDLYRYRWCLCLLLVVLFSSHVCAQEPTPSPVRIPDTIPPDPTPPPSILATPIPTAPPPTTEPPTEAPTEAPTVPPTAAPTVAPTVAPTKAPTVAPTVPPTAAPTVPPTVAPTVSPTPLPTVPPTPKPSALPSSTPSAAPSPLPSATPTNNPTALLEPTAVPTVSSAPSTPIPSELPSYSPSYAPTGEPTVSPSQQPSSSPSVSPTLSLQESIVEVFMTFDNAPRLKGKSVITFEAITTQFIRQELKTSAEPPMYDMDVWTNVKNQVVPSSSETRGRHVRVLQQSPIVIVFDTAVDFRSVGTDHDVPQLVGGTWDTEQDQNTYIAALKATGDVSFQQITSMKTEINGWEPGSDDDNKNQDIDLFIIIGASVGGAALLFLLGMGFIFMRRRRRAKKKSKPTVQQTSALTFATPQQPMNGERISTEIVVDHQDDVSTLGDPMFGAGGMLIPGLEKDETVAASSFVSGDYEYAKAYRLAEEAPNSVATDTLSKRTGMLDGSERGSSSALDLGQEDPFFSDDSSFEEQYQDGEIQIIVRAPPGKLGMVIDTPSGGMPVVHAIKDTSVLANEVKVGDRLMSVDNEDCTCMSAMQVSKLISQRAQNPSRAFVFSRSRGRIMSKDA